LYGDGVFEGIRAYNGYVFKLKEHLDRLYDSARAILLDIPLSKGEIQEAVLETLRQNDLKTAYIRLVISRGFGRLGINPAYCERPNIIIITQEWKGLYSEELYQKGLKAIVAAIRNKPPEGLPPIVKSLNYLTNVLAKIEANVKGADEAIMLDVNGNVSEAAAANIFIVKGERIYTPPVMNNLPGITRETIIELARDSYQVLEENFGIASLYMADEVFMTGTAAEVAPIVEIDGRVIGEGVPGPVTLELREKFKEITGIPQTGVSIY
jgi:branched-chain amino acid aminotransferase